MPFRWERQSIQNLEEGGDGQKSQRIQCATWKTVSMTPGTCTITLRSLLLAGTKFSGCG